MCILNTSLPPQIEPFINSYEYAINFINKQLQYFRQCDINNFDTTYETFEGQFNIAYKLASTIIESYKSNIDCITYTNESNYNYKNKDIRINFSNITVPSITVNCSSIHSFSRDLYDLIIELPILYKTDFSKIFIVIYIALNKFYTKLTLSAHNLSDYKVFIYNRDIQKHDYSIYLHNSNMFFNSIIWNKIKDTLYLLTKPNFKVHKYMKKNNSISEDYFIKTNIISNIKQILKTIYFDLIDDYTDIVIPYENRSFNILKNVNKSEILYSNNIVAFTSYNDCYETFEYIKDSFKFNNIFDDNDLLFTKNSENNIFSLINDEND